MQVQSQYRLLAVLKVQVQGPLGAQALSGKCALASCVLWVPFVDLIVLAAPPCRLELGIDDARRERLYRRSRLGRAMRESGHLNRCEPGQGVRKLGPRRTA